MQSEFTGMLQALQGRFQQDPSTAATAPCETVQALEETIASLQQIKIGLEETKEFRAAQAEKALTVKGNRMLQLTNRAEEAKAAAEKLLGYPLKPEHFTNGQAYSLMPVGFVERLHFEAAVQHFQGEIARLKDLQALKPLSSCRPTFGLLENSFHQAQRTMKAEEDQLRKARSRLLGYLMTHRPMQDATFTNKLAAHIDTMLEAYLELRALEQ